MEICSTANDFMNEDNQYKPVNKSKFSSENVMASPTVSFFHIQDPIYCPSNMFPWLPNSTTFTLHRVHISSTSPSCKPHSFTSFATVGVFPRTTHYTLKVFILEHVLHLLTFDGLLVSLNLILVFLSSLAFFFKMATLLFGFLPP